RRGVLSTDLLLLSGVAAAFGYSILSVWRTSFGFSPGHVYFEVGCMILVMVSLGRWLEATGKLRSTQALDQLQKLLPAQVDRLTSAKQIEQVPLNDIQPGDQIQVRAGDRIPTDGLLVSPSASVDEQLICGESWPREKSSGDQLCGGTLNLAGTVVMTVTATAAEGTLARLIAAVREARLQRGEYEQLADRISRWFFPVMLLIAVVTFLLHAVLNDAMTGLMAALSVILIACPCALGLATPIALWAAMGTAARRGIVFRSPMALERLATLKAIRFDKTGTLTTGQPSVADFVVAEGTDPAEARRRALALASSSSHVFSRSIVNELSVSIDDVRREPMTLGQRSITGRGICGHWEQDGQEMALGNQQLMEELRLQIPPSLETPLQEQAASGQPYVLLGWDRGVRGLFLMRESLRDSAREVAHWTTQAQLDAGVLTGDHVLAGQRLERELNLPVSAGLTPQDKAEVIRHLHDEVGSVVFVGDGVNDAPALALADVGISLGCGADVTRDSADICLLSDDIAQLPGLVELSQRTVDTIRRNLFWAFAYNSCGVLAAATGMLHPAIAAILMVGSSLFVITNSLRLNALAEALPPAGDGSPLPAAMSTDSRANTVSGNSASTAPPSTVRGPSIEEDTRHFEEART
ncbi:MAG: cation-translocating P-type ATPase, partial [Planctomycetaceae bacterium]|nr:cation-translocating P-type ATPase [Planctomycetaceae bacterium]